jgi:hypothetical protein
MKGPYELNASRNGKVTQANGTNTSTGEAVRFLVVHFHVDPLGR